MTDKETTELIYKLLREKYFESYSSKGRNWITIREARIGTGYSGLNTRSIDFLAISSKAGNEVIGHEIKASRGDFLNDLKNQEKQKGLRCFANLFYYIAPAGVIKAAELPAWVGLMELEYSEITKNYWISEKIKAPSLHNFAPTWGFVAACIRNRTEPQVKALEVEIEELKQKLHTLENELQGVRLRRFILKEAKDNAK